MRILIIGGGIIGLSIGWQLARHGRHVEIFERDVIGKEASWAAAGMLAPYSEISFEDDLNLQLGCKGLALYSQFLNELHEDTKIDLSLENQGTLYVGIGCDDRVFLERLFHEIKRKNHLVKWLSAIEAREKEPLLSPHVSTALWIPNETHIHNRKLLESLKKAFHNRGGILHEHCPVERLWIHQGCLKGLWTTVPIAGECVINAAGAWTDIIHKKSSRPIYPNKGQILTLSIPAGMTLNYMIRTPRVYLVPKHDGSLRVGATSEEVGFDKSITAGAVLKLLQAAYEVVPCIASMILKEIEAKLRPASFDNLPSVGKTELKGYFRAAGHGRSGILLAPYTAYEMVKKLCKSE